MVKWSDCWLEKIDGNGVKVGLWASKKSQTHAFCNLCFADLKFLSQGFQALVQHATKPKHKSLSDIRFSKNVRKLTQNLTNTSSQAVIALNPTLNEQVAASEAKWIFKIAERDMTLRDCDDMPSLFKSMFPDSAIAKDFSMSRQKASYVLQDGIGPLLTKYLSTSICRSESAFTLMFDETTTLQNRKQMDILIRYWNEEENTVSTRYLTSVFFGRAKAIDVTERFMAIHDEEHIKLPWSRLFNISSDGPNINKAIWREFNNSLIGKGYKGLLAFINCPLHTVHNAFHRGIQVGLGETAEQLAFDLHAWFKHSPCKAEDFVDLADSVSSKNEALFIRHLNTRWLTLTPTLELVLLRWDDCKKYFLNYLPAQKEYKAALTKNKRYKRIKKYLTEEEQGLLVVIKFLIGIAPVFKTYLTVFQNEGPLIHCMYSEMRNILLTVLKRFVKPSIMNAKPTKDLLTLDLKDSANHLELEKMDFGREAKKQADMCTRTKKVNQELMRDALIRIGAYLQKNLPLNSTTLKDVSCLSPLVREKEWTVRSIERLAGKLPHIVKEREVSLLVDQWKVYQLEEIPEEWYQNPITKEYNRIDYYWSKVLKIKSISGNGKFGLLSKLVKSFLCLHNGNADVERSLSDNKNVLTAERTKLSDETLSALRIAKEYARACGGAHCVNTVSKDMVKAVQQAHAKFEERKRQEKEEQRKEEELKKKQLVDIQKQKEMIEKAEKRKCNLDQKEQQLIEDEKELDGEFSIAQRLLEGAKLDLDEAIDKDDMIGVKVAREMIQSTSTKLAKISRHKDEQQKIRTDIGSKRKSAFEKLMQSYKKKK